MTDPAIEAAQRAWVRPRGAWALSHFDPNSRLEKAHIDAAREALKPIRELHRPVDTFLWANAHCQNDHDVTNDTSTGDDVCLTCTAADGGPVKTCEECFADDGSNIDWPCATAKLIYTTEELA